MPINGACESGPIIADLTTPSPAQTSYESVISFSSNSFGNSDSISDKSIKKWADANNDTARARDCVNVTKSGWREERDYREEPSGENSEQNVLNLHTPRRNVKREATAATVNRCQPSPATTASRSTARGGVALHRSSRNQCYRNGEVKALQASGSASTFTPPTVSSTPKKCSTNRKREQQRKKSKELNSQHKKKVITRSVTRLLGPECCVLDPPTPEDALEIKEWPAEDVHECLVCPNHQYETAESPSSELEISLHNALHALLAYVAQFGRSISDEAEPNGLTPTDSSCTPYSKNKESLDVCTNMLTKKDQLNGLENLLINTGILYCAVCSVSQKALAEYIDSLSMESALQWFQEAK